MYCSLCCKSLILQTATLLCFPLFNVHSVELKFGMNIEHLISSSAAPKKLARHSCVCVLYYCFTFHIMHSSYFSFIHFISFHFSSLEFRLLLLILCAFKICFVFRIHIIENDFGFVVQQPLHVILSARP